MAQPQTHRHEHRQADERARDAESRHAREAVGRPEVVAAPRALVPVGRPQRRLDEDVAETQGEASDRRLRRRRDERGQLENRPLRRRAARWRAGGQRVRSISDL